MKYDRHLAGMAVLKIRSGKVESVDNAGGRVDRAEVRVRDEELRPALSYPGLTGPIEVGDEVLLNVEAADLGLGSGGFDIVMANLSRGLEGGRRSSAQAHVMKLNYTPLQHAVNPVEEELGFADLDLPLSMEVGVLALHSQLAGAAYALSREAPDARVAFVQTAGGALHGALSDTVDGLLQLEHLDAHVTVSPCFGGKLEALTVLGALQACDRHLNCDVALIGPGPGIQGSESLLGHGGIQAIENAHSALSLNARPVLVPRVSEADERDRHRGLSHHTATVLQLLLGPVDVALAEESSIDGLEDEIERANPEGRHNLMSVSTNSTMEGYEKSGLPAESMGRTLKEDPEFFRHALAGGLVLAERLKEGQ